MALGNFIKCLPAIVPSVIVCIEVFLRLPFFKQVKSIKDYSLKSFGVISTSNISDHWKEKVLPAYAMKIFKASLRFFLFLLLLIFVFVLVYITISLLTIGKIDDAMQLLYLWKIQIGIFIFSVLYFVVRNQLILRNKVDKNNYTIVSKILHQMALSNTAIKEVAFDIDCAVTRFMKFDTPAAPPVYVAGLARGGTTILLETLYKTGSFSTLTYRDMPFVTAPWIWSRLSGKFYHFTGLKERAHGDRLMVNYDSPEAFEEVFWSTFAPEKYIDDSGLKPWEADNNEEAIKKYRQFVSTVINRKKKGQALQYLAKNNNNLLRIDTIKAAFPDAIIIVPFRHPLSHAASLRNQHERFLQVHKEDRFALKYMNWLGHFEFGANFKPFKMNGSFLPDQPESLLSVEYWLNYWKSVYEYIIDTHTTQVIFFDYNQFCNNPDSGFQKLERLLNLSSGTMDRFISDIKPAKMYDSVSESLLTSDIKQVYERLRNLSINMD